MDDSDKRKFVEILNGTSDYYGVTPLTHAMLNIYFGGLGDYSIDQVEFAIGKHMADTKVGNWMPKIAHILKHINGSEVTADQVLASARLADTPFGILCRIQIGTYDLEHQTDMFYLKQRAEECLLLLPKWKRDAAQGVFTNHEISIMLKHEVNPLKPFTRGLAAPANKDQLRERIHYVRQSSRHMLTLEVLSEDDDKKGVPAANVSEFLNSIID